MSPPTTRLNPTDDIILWGGTGQAKVLAEFLPASGWRLVAIFDNNPDLKGSLCGAPIVGGSEFQSWLASRSSPPAALVAIGGDRGEDRLKIQAQLEVAGCRIPSIIHPAAYVANDAEIGSGSQILAKSLVGAGSRVGRAVIVNSSASVDHECLLEDGVHIGPGAVLCGLVTVGRGSFIAAGSVVLPRIRIGAGSVVGAGAVVTRDIPDNVIAYGNPARIIRPRSAV